MSSEPTPELLGQRVFTEQDQQFFASISRDLNPMHVDPVAARRLMTGHQVVHGIHTAMVALDLWCAGRDAAPRSIAVTFANPVSVGEPVVFTKAQNAAGQASIVASVHGLPCTEILLELGNDGAAPALHSGVDALGRVVRCAQADEPLDEPPGSQVQQVFTLGAWGVPAEAAFPNACRVLGPSCLAGMAKLSYFVGMVCPGLHSIFSEARFEISGDMPANSALTFLVRRYDARFRLFMVSFDGCIRGELKAFLRPPPRPQPSSREMLQHVLRDEFRGTRALVIGGSRGLGEVTVKILAAGSGAVTLTYAAGIDDARRVCTEVAASGLGRCEARHLDLRLTDFDDLGISAEPLDAVYFFATPRIFTKKASVFDRASFDEFVWFYLQRFYELCTWLEARTQDRPIKVYLPSTVFIAERPKGMTEYAMVKAAAEVMVADLNRSMRNVVIVYSRLPRLATDQTASIQDVTAGSSVATMLEVVRSMAA